MSDLPTATHHGTLTLGLTKIPCFVTSDGRRVVSMRETAETLAGRRDLNLRRMLSVSGVKSFMGKDLIARQTVAFHDPSSGAEVHGLDSDQIVAICEAFVSALAAGTLRTDRQREIASKCAILLAGCARVGLAALIDEATGYQKDRDERAMQAKLDLYLSDYPLDYRVTFGAKEGPFYRAIRRVYGWPDGSDNPHMGAVTAWVYQTFDPDILPELRARATQQEARCYLHQFLNESIKPKFHQHLQRFIGLARAFPDDKDGFKAALETAFGKQLEVNVTVYEPDPHQLLMPFMQIMDVQLEEASP